MQEAPMQDAPTPDEVENASFPESQHGYDRTRVDVFLRRVAREMRRLQRDLEVARERGEAPYRAAGKEIGDLLQRAKELARELVTEAEHRAARALQDSHRESRRLTGEAAAAEAEARRSADRMVSDARAEAGALVDRARRVKARAEAEARIALQEAERDARRTRQEAKAAAARLREEAERDAAAHAERLERRVRALQEAEAALRLRAAGLKSRDEPPGDRRPPLARPKPETG